MADQVHTPESASIQSRAESLNKLAGSIQDDARELWHLLDALDDAADNLCPTDEAEGNALDRIIIFCRAAKAVAKRTGDTGEKIEVLDLAFRRAAEGWA